MKTEVGSREHFNYVEQEYIDNGVSVADALKLIEGTEYYEDAFHSMGIDKIKNDFIEISGAKKLVTETVRADSSFEKFDVVSELRDVKCNGLLDKKSVILELFNIDSIKAQKIIGSDKLKATSKYSVKSDYLDGIYSADKFMNYCLDRGYDDFIKENLEYVEENNSNSAFKKQFRILKNNDEEYFVRAITSANRYKDYNIKFSVFVALIALHKLKRIKKEEYYVRYFSVSESDIRVVFGRLQTKKIMSGVSVGFELELVNDEVKREAVKFNGLFSISYGDGKVLSIKPDLKARIISFPHTVGVTKVSAIIENMPELIDEFTEMMYGDIELIKKSKSPSELKKLLYLKVKNAKMKEFREKYKSLVRKTIEKENVNTFLDLLDLMNKVDLLIDDSDIKAKDYWRYKLYEVLVKGKKEELK